MAFSPERIEEIKELIRSYTIRDPGIGSRRIGKLLGLDKMTANKYLKEVRADRAKQLKKEIDELQERSVSEELVETKEEFREAMNELWKIITSKKSTRTQKVQAIRTLVRTKKELFEMMLDAGLFKRHLGEGSINLTEIFKAIEKKSKDEMDKGK